MIKLTDFSAVIFDMDGLVLDTESTYCIAWQKAAKSMGYEFTTEFCLSFSGLHYADVELKLIDYCGTDFNLQTFNSLSGDCWLDQLLQLTVSTQQKRLRWLPPLYPHENLPEPGICCVDTVN